MNIVSESSKLYITVVFEREWYKYAYYYNLIMYTHISLIGPLNKKIITTDCLISEVIADDVGVGVRPSITTDSAPPLTETHFQSPLPL